MHERIKGEMTLYSSKVVDNSDVLSNLTSLPS